MEQTLRIHDVVAHLKNCANKRDLYTGRDLHAFILKKGVLKRSILLSSTLISVYANCGNISCAQQVFDEIPAPDIVSWTALIAAYAQSGHGEEALNCFARMESLGISPNAITFACILKACGSIQAAERGSEVHAEIIRKGLLIDDPVLGTALVDMYIKRGDLAKAQEAFDKLPAPNVFSWTSLITGYAQQEHAETGLICCMRMQDESLIPSSVTLVCALQACSSLGAVEKGKRIHAVIKGNNLQEGHGALGNALADMYVKCGALSMGEQVFNELLNPGVVSWNTLIAGFSQHEQFDKALDCFDWMRREGPCPNAVTYTCILRACGSIGAWRKGKEVHAQIVQKGLLGKDDVLGNALVDFYVKSGDYSRARQEFCELLVPDVVSWNVLIAGFAQHSRGEQALACFEQMQREGLSPNTVTFLCILQACGSLGACEKGMGFHSQIVREGLLEKDSVLGAALVDMYGKCSALVKAQEVFDKLPLQHVVSWTALMAGYAQAGKDGKVFALYNKMVKEGIEPNPVTFTVLLTVCGHLGLVEESQKYFVTMSANYGIVPALQHHTCMVDLFGRLGHFDEAVALIERMPLSLYLPTWVSLLSACGRWGNWKLGSIAFQNAVCSQERLAVITHPLQIFEKVA